MKEMLYEVRCLKSNEDMILALAGQFQTPHFTALQMLYEMRRLKSNEDMILALAGQFQTPHLI